MLADIMRRAEPINRAGRDSYLHEDVAQHRQRRMVDA